MSDVWQCPVWHPGDCGGTPMCPPRCPRYVTEDGTVVTIHSGAVDDLVAIGDDGAPLGGARLEEGIVHIEVASDASTSVGVEVCRQVIARAHERGERRLTLEAPEPVIDRLTSELEPAIRGREPGRLVVEPDHPATSPLTLAPASGGEVSVADRVGELLDPEVVALFGATDRQGSIGRVLLENIKAFDGTVLPVSDRSDELLGLETVSSLDGHTTDLAVIALPAAAVEDAVDEAIRAECTAVAILSAGFGESDASGEALESRLAKTLTDAGVTAVGPNAIGVLRTARQLNASFAPTMPPEGTTSIVSHSGAMITAMLEWASANDVGIRDVISLGNEIDLSASEVIRYWGRSPETELIVAYLEDLREGRSFVEAARDVTPTTPIIALKSGRTDAGATAARSHTGAVSGDDAGYEAAFEAAGVIRAEGQDELFDLIEAFSSGPIPTGDRVAIVTNAGGPGVIAADAIGASDLRLAEFTTETRDRLDAMLPDETAVANPLDVLGDASVERFVQSLENVFNDPGVDAVILTSTPHPLVSLPSLIEAVDALVPRYQKPVFACFPGTVEPAVKTTLSRAQISGFTDATRAVRTLEALLTYHRNRRRPRASIDPIGADGDIVEGILDMAETTGRGTLGVESFDLLTAYGVDVASTKLVTSPGAAVTATESMGGTAVLKAIAPALAHKTDVGGVQTGVPAQKAATAYRDIVDDVEAALGVDSVTAVGVQEPIEGGIEVLVGVTHHERLGPLVTVGLGGVFVEHLEDVAHGLAPLSRQSARDLLGSLDAETLLREGPRGGTPPDLDALADAIARISRIVADHDRISSLEVNPVIATEEGAIAVDLLVDLR